MKEKRHYFSLKIKGGNEWHRSGQRVKSADRSVSLGESADCDVRFDAHGYEPEYYASILRNDDGKSWRIVRRSSHAALSIDGKGAVGIAQQLTDGDIIRIEGQPVALQFNTHYDCNYDDGGGHRSVWPWVAMAAVCLMVVAALALRSGNERRISVDELEKMEESILKIRVDSVQWLKRYGDTDYQMRPTKVLQGDAPMGTAFMTTDGRIVTARHCVEYWIGQNLDLTTKVASLPKDDIVRWAIETETYNQTHDSADTLMLLRVYFSVYNFTGDNIMSLSSTDSNVHINKRDCEVYMMADFSGEYYWRSVRPYFQNREMELGDILWIDNACDSGHVELAKREDLAQLRRGTQVMVCGYPLTGGGNSGVVFAEGRISVDYAENGGNFVFEGNVNHGFSGGPVLVKTANGIVAAGIVSRVDSVSSGIFKWAVPVSAIDAQKGGKDER